MKLEFERGFYFYEVIDKPLDIVATSLQEFMEKLEIVPIISIEFHQERGDFSRWIKDVLEEEELAGQIEDISSIGEDLRKQLIDKINAQLKSVAECPRCGFQIMKPVKAWIRRGKTFEIRMGHYKCPRCETTFRKRVA